MGDEVSALAADIVNVIIRDLRGRSGIGDEWNTIDDDIQDEIARTLREAVDELLEEGSANGMLNEVRRVAMRHKVDCEVLDPDEILNIVGQPR